jgi:PKD repeat protein
LLLQWFSVLRVLGISYLTVSFISTIAMVRTFPLGLVLLLGFVSGVCGQVPSPPLFSHAERPIGSAYCIVVGDYEMSYKMGKDRFVAGSMTSFNETADESNVILDSNGVNVLTYQPPNNSGYSNVQRQFSCIDANRIVWYGFHAHATGQANDTVHFTRMTEQGGILSQFKLPGYGIRGMFADTLGKVFCFLTSNTGSGMARFSLNGSLDFVKWNTNQFPFLGANVVKYGSDGRFYLKYGSNWLVMDRNGNVLKLLVPPSGYSFAAAYPDHGIAATKYVGGWLNVVRLDSNLVPVWKRQLGIGMPMNGTDTILQAIDGTVVPYTKELVLACEVRDSISFYSACWPPHTWEIHALVIGDDGIARQKQWLYPNYVNKRLMDLSVSPYGQPLLTSFDNSCFGPSYHDAAVEYRAMSLVAGSPECYANYRYFIGANSNNFVVGSGVLGTLPSNGSLFLSLVPEVVPINFTGCITNYGLTSCPRPCANLYGVQVLGAGQVQFQDSIYGYHRLQYSFGDGTFGSVADPLHSYPGNGNYQVSLIAENECGADTAYWGMVNPCLAANMNHPVTGCVGVLANFSQATSYPAGNIEWLLNGVSAGTGNSFSFTPTAVGNYQIGIVYHDLPCHDTTVQSFPVSNGVPVPNFSMAAVSGNAVHFTNQTIAGGTYAWTFGDGGTSTQANPNHTYTGTGPYQVCLTATNACGSAVLCQTWNCPFPSASFTSTVASSLFTGQATGSGAGVWNWDFGDGQTGSGSTVTHTYAVSGTYTVCLYASSICAADTVCQTISVTANNRAFWRKTYNHLANSDPRGQAVNATWQTLIVGGSTQGEFMLLLDSTGSVLWTQTLPTANYSLQDVAAMPNGHFLVVGGTTASGPSQMNGLWMEVDLAGNITNAHANGTTTYDRYTGAKPARNGGYILTGTTGTSFFPNADGTYTKLDANLGVQWSRKSHEYAHCGFEMADGTYWIVQTDRSASTGRLQFVHLDVNGIAFEERKMVVSNASIPIIDDVFAEIDCNNNVYFAFDVTDYRTGWSANLPVFATGRMNLTTYAGTGKGYPYSTGSSTIADYDVSVRGLMLRPDGNLIAVGSAVDHTFFYNPPMVQQAVWQISSSTLAVSEGFYGATATDDSHHCASGTVTGATIAAGLAGNALSIQKFSAFSDCQLGTTTYLTRLSPYNFGPVVYNNALTYPTAAFGTVSTFSVNPANLPGIATVACLTNCSTAVAASFTYTVSGNLVTITSTSTAGAALVWNVAGQSCLVGNPITLTLPCGTTMVSLTASNGCMSSTVTQPVFVPGNFSVSVGPNQTVCPGSLATFTATPGYSSYLWSNGSTNNTITVAAPGTYTVTVGNGTGCTVVSSATLSHYVAPTIALSPSPHLCQGGTAVLNAGAGFSSYLWSTGATSSSILISSPGLYTVTLTYGLGCFTVAPAAVSYYATPVVNLGPNVSVCAGSSAVLNAGTGFGSYLWSTGSTNNSISVSMPGTYSVTVVDANGCSGNGSTTLANNALPVVNLGPNISVCAGSSAVLNAGTGFSSYLWSTGSVNQSITVSAPGTYSVTVTDANGCEGIDSVTLSNYALPVVNLGPNVSVCTGSSAVLNAGTGFSSYLWSMGSVNQSITVSAAGTYSVTVTDANGCEAADSVTLSNYALPVVNLWPNPTVCVGDSAVLDAGTGFSSYLWSTGSVSQSITVSAAGTYSVTVTDANGCEGIGSAVLSFFAPNSVFLGNDTAIFAGNPLTLNAGSGFVGYLWSDGSTGTSIVVSTSGTYWVQVTDDNGCVTRDTIQVSVLTAVGGAYPLQFEVSPVPTSNFLRVRVTAPGSACLRFSLVDLSGKLLLQRAVECDRMMAFDLDVRGVAAGVYFLRLEGEGVVLVRKVIIDNG